MHHRRNRTMRRENKRLEDKSYRAAEKRALHNGQAGYPPHDSWGYRPEPLPLGDVSCNGKKRSKKIRRPKDRCPANRVHEWYRERVIDEYTYQFPWSVQTTRREYEVSTCIHCWKVKREFIRALGGWRAEWRDAKKVLPKRPVKF